MREYKNPLKPGWLLKPAGLIPKQEYRLSIRANVLRVQREATILTQAFFWRERL